MRWRPERPDSGSGNWRDRLRNKAHELAVRAEELYGEQATEPEVVAPSRPPLSPGQGLMTVDYFPGIRLIHTPVRIWEGRFGAILNGDMPHPADKLPPHIEFLKAVASRAIRKGDFEMVTVTRAGVGIDFLSEDGPDRNFVDIKFYEAVAESTFAVAADLSSIRLEIDQKAPERAYSGRVILRSMFEPPADPAPAT
jgi:hypothetical protein